MSLKEVFSKSINIIVIARKIATYDKACAIIGLVKSLEHSNRKVDLLVKGRLSQSISTLFEKNSSLYITNISPPSFEITIDYGTSSVEKIVYDDIVEEKKLKFSITPGSSGFNFDSVHMVEGGVRYDTCILIDIEDPKLLKDLYDTQEYLFKEIPVISVGSKVYEKSTDIVVVEKDSSYSEALYNYLKDNGLKLGKQSVEILLNGIINYRKILEGSYSSNSWGVLSSLLKDGADLSKGIKDVYFSKSKLNSQLQIKAMQNVKVVEDQSLIYSIVTKVEVEKLGLNKNEIDLRGRIPFNISNEYKLAIMCIELEEGVFTTVVESNAPEEISAVKFALMFGGSGSESHSRCTIKHWKYSEFEKKISDVLKRIAI